MKKKILAMLTAAALCVGMLPSTVLADVEQSPEDVTTVAVMEMSAMSEATEDEIIAPESVEIESGDEEIAVTEDGSVMSEAEPDSVGEEPEAEEESDVIYNETAEPDTGEDAEIEDEDEDIADLSEIEEFSLGEVAEIDDDYDVVELTLNQSVTAPGGEVYDYYSFTPTESGLYYFYTSREVQDLTLYYYDPDYGRYLGRGGGSESTDFFGLNADTTYYLRVQNDYESDYDEYAVTVTGTQESDNPITLDMSYSITGPAVTIYTYTPEESGLYMFTSDAGSAIGAYTFYTSYYDPSELYNAGAEGSMSFYMDAGQTYYVIVYSEGADSVMLTTGTDDFIEYFTKRADKTSAGSGDKIEYTLQAQVVEPTYSELRRQAGEVNVRDWEPDDFTLTFHDTLDEGLELDEDSFVVKYYRGGSSGTVFTISDDNLDHNILDVISTDTTDGDSFEVTIDLTEMYWTETGTGYYIDDFSELEDSYFEVTYNASLAENVTPGVYNNTAHVSSVYTVSSSGQDMSLTSGTKELAAKPVDGQNAAYEDVSDEVVVPVYTYGLVIYKYDSASWPTTTVAEKPDWIPDETVPLTGAEFELYDAYGNLLGTLVTDSDGCAYSTSMTLYGETVSKTFADGTQLFIKETKAPDGYELDEGWAKGYEFMIEAQYAESDYWYWGTVGNVKSPVYGSFDIDKVDEQGNVLSRAEFVLGYFWKNNDTGQQVYALTPDGDYYYYYGILNYDDTSGTYVFDWDQYSDTREDATKLTTEDDGKISISNLPVSSTYETGFFLIETKAPDRYELLEDPIVFTVSDDGTIQIAVSNDQASMNDDGTVMTVVDEPTFRFFPLDEEIVPNNDDEEDPDSWVKRESVNEYDAIEIEMSTTLPKVDGSVLAEGDFSMTFHNQLDTALILDDLESDFKVDIGGQPIDGKYYEIDMIQATRLVQPVSISDGCAFHVNVDLSALYNDGVIGDEDLGTATIRVFFYADLETTDINSSYISTAWYDVLSDGEVIYTSGTSTVAVYTFEIIIDKYDTETGEALSDATFGLYYDEACENAVSRNGEDYTVTSDESGQAMFVGIAEGTYYLKELEAPDGYELIEEPVTVTLEGSDDDDEIEHVVEVSVGNTPVSDETPEPDEPRDPEKSADVEAGVSVSAGDEVTYTITYYNNNVISALVTITDALDTGVDYVSSDPAGEYDADTHTVTWTLTAEAFEEGSVQLTVKVNESAAGSVVDNTAAVQIGNADSVDTNTVVIPVEPDTTPEPDEPRDPEKSADVEAGASVSAGDEITYTITYYNNNSETALVTIKDALDAGVDYVSSDLEGEYDADTHTVVWNIEAEAYEEGSVQLTVKVNESAAGSVVDNTAAVQIGNADSVDTNTVEIPVKSENEDNPNPNEPGTGNPDSSNPNTTGGTKTSDVDMTYLWILLMIAAAAVAVAGVTLRTRPGINK